MNNHHFFYLGAIFSLCAGCSTFSHQTSQHAPHALLLIRTVCDDTRCIKSIDEEKVTSAHQNKSYRLLEGMHSVTIQERKIETIQYTNKPEDTLARAMINLSGKTPIPPSSYQEVSNIKLTEHFLVDAGKSYVLTPHIIGKPANEKEQKLKSTNE